MTRTLKLAALALITVLGFAPVSGFAATQDYHAEVVGAPLHMGKDTPISVKLVNTVTGKAVTDATIIGQKLNMLMGTMTMPGQVKVLPTDASGNYQFAGDLTTAGDWQLDLVVKVPGETDNLLALVKFQVAK